MLQEIKTQVRKFLAGKSTLIEFEDWLIPRTWDTKKLGDDAHLLSSEILLAIAEHDMGHLDDDEFKARLAELLPAEKISSSNR